MADKRRRITGRRSGHTFAAKPHNIFRADCKNKIPSAASVLSHKAAHLLDNLIAQYDGKNNGDLSAAPKIMKLYGWSSQGSVYNGLVELLGYGFIEQTRQGGKNQCSLYAVTWHAIDECNGKLDVNPTKVASNLWKPENAGKIDRRFVEAWNKQQQKSQLNTPLKLKSVDVMRTNDVAIRTSH
ncbi:conserved hypothetical protein [Candidatus Methylobacter favarea]|uniref:Uncharacterized protein n=1 Tax=Candidatus Methylobacter favarea TaxID=2707345 RepID=A0A8S0XF97_9GAMM|nr:hypothetical protein [Candidatus Methylobacter favarea]CAA9890314.1 conserved hypothetical protein [Candidatus Methylobacter favarea]